MWKRKEKGNFKKRPYQNKGNGYTKNFQDKKIKEYHPTNHANQHVPKNPSRNDSNFVIPAVKIINKLNGS
jgi:hypothetical protein